jgi:hypothetical protein
VIYQAYKERKNNGSCKELDDYGGRGGCRLARHLAFDRDIGGNDEIRSLEVSFVQAGLRLCLGRAHESLRVVSAQPAGLVQHARDGRPQVGLL